MISINDIPKGFVEVEILIDDNDVLYNTELVAGHMSTYSPNNTTLKPHVEWLLRIKKERPPCKNLFVDSLLYEDNICYD